MRVFGRHYETMNPCVVEIEAGKIKSITPCKSKPEGAIGEVDQILAPGLVDIQVNGYAGFDLNANDVSPDVLLGMREAMIKTGVTTFCPTVTTGSRERMIRSMRSIVKAAESREISDSIACIHMEGPYISSEDGPRGAHPLEHTRDPDWDEFRQIQDAAEGMIRYVTLAPEREGAIGFIEKLVADGILVALGHTGAETEQIEAAVASGVRLSTHLGNGAHARIRRHPNYIWDQLATDELYASIIPDGHHLPPNVVKCFVRCKGESRIIGVTDAIAPAGMPPGIYGKVEVRADGRAGLAGTEYLAGSTLRLDRGVANLVKFAGVTLKTAIDMCTKIPAMLLGIDDQLGSIEEGKTGNLILFDWNDQSCEINLTHTIINGEVAFSV